MGNFDEHVQYGVGAHVAAIFGVTTAALTTAFPVELAALTVLSFPLTMIGATLPDIDHHASKPNKIFRKFLFILGTLIGGYLGGALIIPELLQLFAESNIPVSTRLPLATVAVVAGSLVAGLGTEHGYKIVRPRHRGITHRAPFGFGISLILSLLTWGLLEAMALSFATSGGLLVGALFLTGFFSHLACDGVLTKPETYGLSR